MNLVKISALAAAVAGGAALMTVHSNKYNATKLRPAAIGAGASALALGVLVLFQK